MVHMPSTSACFLAVMQVHSHHSTSKLSSGADFRVAWNFFIAETRICTIRMHDCICMHKFERKSEDISIWLGIAFPTCYVRCRPN